MNKKSVNLVTAVVIPPPPKLSTLSRGPLLHTAGVSKLVEFINLKVEYNYFCGNWDNSGKDNLIDDLLAGWNILNFKIDRSFYFSRSGIISAPVYFRLKKI